MNLASGISNYPRYDQVGSLRAITDTTGNVVKQIDYDSFGNVISDSNVSMTIPFGFAGGLYDYDVGLVRFGFRDYDPAIGRWTAKDPIDFAGGDVNLFGYTGNDPVNFVDPTGLKALCTYSQSSGHIVCYDDETGEKFTESDSCYAGRDQGKDNPKFQDRVDLGPIPQGLWVMHPGFVHNRTGPNSVPLYPLFPNDIYSTPRNPRSFLLHSDSQSNPGSASKGCPVCPLGVRNAIREHGGGLLLVVP